MNGVEHARSRANVGSRLKKNSLKLRARAPSGHAGPARWENGAGRRRVPERGVCVCVSSRTRCLVTCARAQVTFPCADDEFILDAAEENGYELSRAPAKESCKKRAVSGVDDDDDDDDP